MYEIICYAHKIILLHILWKNINALETKHKHKQMVSYRHTLLVKILPQTNTPPPPICLHWGSGKIFHCISMTKYSLLETHGPSRTYMYWGMLIKLVKALDLYNRQCAKKVRLTALCSIKELCILIRLIIQLFYLK